MYWDTRRNAWKASMKIDGKTRNVGRYSTDLEAATAADKFIEDHDLDRKKNFN